MSPRKISSFRPQVPPRRRRHVAQPVVHGLLPALGGVLERRADGTGEPGGKPWSHGYPMDIPRDIRDIPWNPYIFVGETKGDPYFCGNQLLCCLKLVISTEMSLSNLLVDVPFWGCWTSCSGICWKLDQKKMLGCVKDKNTYQHRLFAEFCGWIIAL